MLENPLWTQTLCDLQSQLATTLCPLKKGTDSFNLTFDHQDKVLINLPSIPAEALKTQRAQQKFKTLAPNVLAFKLNGVYFKGNIFYSNYIYK